MAHNEDRLRAGESLSTGQWLRSTNGLFHAVIQDDGNFVIYRGDWKEAQINTWLWSTMTNDCKHNSYTQGKIAHWCLYLQQDGNIIISEPGGGPVWALTTHHNNVMKAGNSMVLCEDGNLFVSPDGTWNSRVFSTDVTDSVDEKSYEWNDFIYDLAGAKVVKSGPPMTSHAVTSTNHTSVQQSDTLTMTYTKSRAETFKTTTTVKAGFKVFTKAKVGDIGEAGAEVSGELAQGFEWNQTKTVTETVTLSMPVVVPPSKKIAGRCISHEGDMSIPFRGKGTVTFRGLSAKKIPIHIEGVYEATLTHDIETSWTEVDDKGMTFWHGTKKIS